MLQISKSNLTPPRENQWINKGDKIEIQFTVDKPILFHGVHLFGHGENELYEVTTNSGNRSIYRSRYFKNHTSNSDSQSYSNTSYSGFDVLLPSPVLVTANQPLTLVYSIKGPNSYYGVNGKSSVDVCGVKVKFTRIGCSGYSQDRTNVNTGQIYAIFISHCDK